MPEILVVSGALLLVVTATALPGGDRALVAVSVVTLFCASLFVVLMWVRRSQLRAKLASGAVVVGFLFWYAYPALVDLLHTKWVFDSDLPIAVAPRLVPVATTQLLLFLWVWVASVSALGRVRQRKACPRPTSARVVRLVALSVAVGAAGLIPLVAAGMGPASMVAAVLGGRWSDKPWAYWGNLGNESSWYLFLAQSAQIVASALLFAVSVQRRESRQARAWAFVVGAVLLVISFFDQGVRSLTALVVMPTFLLVFVRRRTKSPRSAIALGGLAVLVMFFVSQFQMLFRAPYSRRDLAGLFFEDWPTLGRQIDYFREHLFAISIVPNLHGFFKESVILEFLASPIPRFLWPGKPASEVVWFYTLCRWGVDIWTRPGNIFPGVVGQFYMSWSWFGPVFAGVIFGVASWGGDRFLARHGPEDDPFGFVLGSMLACLLFLSFRNLAPAPFYPLLLAALIVRASRGSGGGLCRRRLATGPGADTSVGDE